MFDILKNFSLKNYNTFGLDVKCDFFVEVNLLEDLINVVEYIKNNNLNYLILSGGSNILFTKNFNGLVFRYVKEGIKVIREDESEVYLEVDAGTNWDTFVEYCVNNNFYGAENLSLIPGNVGAAPIQNIGAYGTELKDIFYSLDFFSFADYKITSYNLKDCKFGYRTSIFKTDLKNKGIITKVIFKLSKNERYNLSYKALENYLQNYDKINLTTIRNAVIEIRESKLPDYKVLGNAGSFFKNPELNAKEFKEFISNFPEAVYFKVNDNSYKISAGWLIENIGFKGKRMGNVGCYEKQALILVNYGGSTGQDILYFSELIKENIYNKFNINLETEVIIN